MAVTVAQLLAQIDELVLEDSTFSSGLWTTSELIDYINVVTGNFIQGCQITKQTDVVTAVAATRSYSEPVDSMSIDRIDFDDVALYRTSRGYLDLENRKWRTEPGRPTRYHQDLLPNKTFEVDKAPTAALAALEFHVISTVLPSLVTTVNDNLTVPDYAAFYIKFGVLEKMLTKQGEAQDLAKAGYCKSRFDFGIELFRGWMAEEEGPGQQRGDRK